MCCAPIKLLLTTLLASLATGCYHFHSVRYPGLAERQVPSDGIQIGAEGNSLTLYGSPTNSGPVTILGAECSLRDSAGRLYSLEFEEPSRPATMTNLFWYHVRAYGPPPSTDLFRFTKGRYELSLAYTAAGERTTLAKPFFVERRSVPFFVVWGAWLMGVH